MSAGHIHIVWRRFYAFTDSSVVLGWLRFQYLRSFRVFAGVLTLSVA